MKLSLEAKDVVKLRDLFHKFESLYKDTEKEFRKFCENNNHKAAVRARKDFQEMKKMTVELRNAIQEAKKRSKEAKSPKAFRTPLYSERETHWLLEKVNPKLADLVGTKKLF